MKTIWTHMNVDLDNAMSVALARVALGYEDAQIKFVSARWDGKDAGPEDLILDVDAGGKGLKGEKKDGLVLSCFSLLLRQKGVPQLVEALQPIAEFVDAQDSKGAGVWAILEAHGFTCNNTATLGRSDVPASLYACSLTGVLNAFRAAYGGDDRKIIESMEPIVRGFIREGYSLTRAKREAREAILMKDDGVPVVALVKDQQEPATARLLFEQGIKILVRQSGSNVTVSRGDDSLNMREIVKPWVDKNLPGEVADWFYHEAGFLAAHGTLKAPAERHTDLEKAEVMGSLLAHLTRSVSRR